MDLIDQQQQGVSALNISLVSIEVTILFIQAKLRIIRCKMDGRLRDRVLLVIFAFWLKN